MSYILTGTICLIMNLFFIQINRNLISLGNPVAKYTVIVSYAGAGFSVLTILLGILIIFHV